MKGQGLLSGLLIVAIWPALALADVAFGADDFEAGSGETEEIVVPREELRREDEYAELYDVVMERDRTKPIEVPGSEEFDGITEGVASMEGYPWPALPEEFDADRDGLSDVDEERIGTAPQTADTDGDGYADGVEVIRQFNPLVPAPGDEIDYDEPDDVPFTRAYSVSGVRLVETGAQKLVAISGVAPENSLVVLLVYSEHRQVWVARADASGRFLYSSAAIPELGNHKVYAAQPTADGAVLAVSQGVEFEVTPERINVPDNPFLQSPSMLAKARKSDEDKEEVSLLLMTVGLVGVGLLVLLIIVMLMLRWFYRRVRRKMAEKVKAVWPGRSDANKVRDNDLSLDKTIAEDSQAERKL